jgi:hypothetical protein
MIQVPSDPLIGLSDQTQGKPEQNHSANQASGHAEQ